jgi:hypothetical protein
MEKRCAPVWSDSKRYRFGDGQYCGRVCATLEQRVRAVSVHCHVNIAEVQSHLYIAVDQGYLSKDAFELIYAQAEKAGRIISGLIKYLRPKQTKSTK